MKKTIQMSMLFLFVWSLFFTALPSTGHACSCVQPPAVQQALADADAVFVGKVTNIKEPKPDALGTISSADPVAVTFQVSQIWKGITDKQVTITTALDSAGCGFEFAADKEYIVYAYQNDAKVLETTICTRTSELTAAGEDLAALGKGQAPTQEAEPPGQGAQRDQWYTYPYIWWATLTALGVLMIILFKKKRV